MFWEIELSQKVRIHPTNLSRDIETSTLGRELRKCVEGLVTPNDGIILHVQKIISFDAGFISFRTGFAIFNVKYSAIVFHPRKGQVIDAVITEVKNLGIYAEAGPLSLFIANKCMPEWYQFSWENSSFVPIVGATAILGNQGKVKQLTTNDQRKNYVLQRGTKIRVKIINAKPHTDLTKLTATATIDDEYLGFIG
ncbi:DNA-directed RNA polymerase II subunit rpb7 [Histomonas meleagridis]|uniref:DNA-directed RNA polymerase II subunit rpb7 n=1 Tax=Histomonas meleagridis TaxID=135588 RepID=UPI00355AB3BF|nr:DNA-directed RNA polymerase II subunit rpb7 [Histomonas meleagridis]KAH0803910.1 DNA-directed RNA polymerase II subunit rpb7 [Histomonas meleagridis]